MSLIDVRALCGGSQSIVIELSAVHCSWGYNNSNMNNVSVIKFTHQTVFEHHLWLTIYTSNFILNNLVNDVFVIVRLY